MYTKTGIHVYQSGLENTSLFLAAVMVSAVQIQEVCFQLRDRFKGVPQCMYRAPIFMGIL